MDLDGSDDSLLNRNLSLKSYHVNGLELLRQQLMAEAPSIRENTMAGDGECRSWATQSHSNMFLTCAGEASTFHLENGLHWCKHSLWPCRFLRVSSSRLVSGMRDRNSDFSGTCE